MPVLVTAPHDGSGRIFVVEQVGRINVLEENGNTAGVFLDVSEQVTAGGEQGLLGLAFHPDFASNGRFFINYTDTAGDTVVAEYHVDPEAGSATPSLTRTVLQIDQPYPNHNGGNLVFGPDGGLYIGMGDGGSADDPEERAQDPSTRLGKLLRVDVDRAEPVVEIWAMGLRNPWRYSFDRDTGDLWLGDVGQSVWEEINHLSPGTKRGVNYGWDVLEGRTCFEPPEGCDRADMQDPVAVYSHEQGCSVTGGHVYRGNEHPALVGTYLFADYCSGTIWGLDAADSRSEARVLLQTDLGISSFGEDESGELYVIDHGGGIYRILVP